MTKNFYSKNQEIAIIGMDASWGSCVGLDAFERSIYTGKQHIISFVDSDTRDEDHRNEERINYEKTLIEVSDRALKDAGVKPGDNVAVIIATVTEAFPQQLKEKWNFTGPALTLAAEENTAYQALLLAEKILQGKEAEIVLVAAAAVGREAQDTLSQIPGAQINTGTNTLSYDQKANGFMVGEGAGAVVVKLYETAKRAKNSIYAVMNAIALVERYSFSQEQIHAEAVTQACLQSFNVSNIKPSDVGYLEVAASGIPQQDDAEINGLLQAYQATKPDLSCAIGSVKANVGHTYAASGITSLIKTALCLYHRYIPATSQWTGVKNPENWQGSFFYVPIESRPWFLAKEAQKRVAAINSIGRDGTYAHVILSEETSQKERRNKYLEQMPLCLFPVAGNNQAELIEKLETLQQEILESSSLSETAGKTFVAFQKYQQSAYTIVILGQNQDELTREIQRALQGLQNAFNQGKDWQSPTGSYFTINPLGKRGHIAFVYPGAFNSYIGLGKDIFRLFPKVWNSPVSHVPNIGEVFREHLLYPRSLNALTRRKLETIEQKLLSNTLAMLETGIGFATFFTEIMRNYFQVKPHCTFGYSLGEISMMCAQGVWKNLAEASRALNSSSLFTTRLSGPKNAVCEYWGLPQGQTIDNGKFWSNYVLIAPVTKVIEYLRNENHVYLTHINTSKEVVIAGDSQACLKLIDNLKCDAFRAPSDDVLHCKAMSSEYPELVKLNSFAVNNIQDTVFYSAAEYKSICLDSHSISHGIAKGLCQMLDFPQLVHQVYKDGTRIFLEAGAGSTCSRWISENLKNKEHVTIALNKRGVDDHTSILRALAKLVSHQVAVDLSPLYSNLQESLAIYGETNEESLLESHSSEVTDTQLTYAGDTMTTTCTNHKSKNNLEENLTYNHQSNAIDMQASMNNFSKESLEIYKMKLANSWNSQYQKLSSNSSCVTNSHSKFLQARQESFQQIAELIELQITFMQQMVEEKCEDE